MTQVSNASKASSALSLITPEQLTTNSWPPSAPSAPSKPKLQKTRPKWSTNSSTMLPHTQRMVSPTEPALWCSPPTLTPASSQNKDHAVAPGHTSSSQTTTPSPDRMDQSSPCHKLSNLSWHQPQRPNLQHSTTPQEKWYPSAMHLRKWDGNNPNHPSRQTIPPPRVSSTTPSSNGELK
ncbi:hypothetical protein ACHAXH_007169 [Discostella pseudostelligera]